MFIFALGGRKTGYTFAYQIQVPGMEDGMRLWRACLLTLLVAFCAARVQAKAHVIIHDPDAPATAVGLSFPFQANSSGGGELTFTNASGRNWFDLEVFTPPPQPMGAITCGGDSFEFCQVFPGEFGQFATIFKGPPGIANGEVFSVDLGSSGWTPNGEFRARANFTATPEPATLLLLVAGIIPVLARKKLF